MCKKSLLKTIGISTLLVGACALGAQAQSSLTTQRFDHNKVYRAQKILSPMTAIMLQDYESVLRKENASMSSIAQCVEKYGLIYKGSTLYAKAIIRYWNKEKSIDYTAYGLLPNVTKGSFQTALIPIENIYKLAQESNIMSISIAEKVEPTMDLARAATNVDSVHEGKALPRPFKGENVVVGILDIGFDYSHPNFFDSTGHSGYRVKRLWELRDTTGTAPSGFSYGSEFTTEPSIIAQNTDNYGQSHGSHVAGIAAGSGGGSGKNLSGVAPKSDLIFVGVSGYNTDFIDGIEYIQRYADSLKKPSVINMSWGGNYGPHDGTSNFDLVCDSFYVGEGKILVGSAGNEGLKNIHLKKKFTASDTSMLSALYFPYSSKGTNGATWVDIWGSVGDTFYAAVHIFNNTTGVYEGSMPMLLSSVIDSTYNFKITDIEASPDTCYINFSSGIDPNNHKHRVSMYVNNNSQDNTNKYALIEIRSKSGQVEMWAVSNSRFYDLNRAHPFYNGDTATTIMELGGTGKNIITVGAFTSKNSWTKLSGGTQTASYYTALGAKAPFSSIGPSADGRMKPDIAAPGNVVVSSVNSFYSGYGYASASTVDSVKSGSKSWYFATMQGTSMAAPMTTGIIALWLEMYPYLSPDQVKHVFKGTAITDTFTGASTTTGSNIWGWGKINAWVNLKDSIPTKPVIVPDTAEICSDSVLLLQAPIGYAKYIWNTGDSGVSISTSSAGAYAVRVFSTAGFKSDWSDSARVIVHPLPPKPSITQVLDTLISSAATGNQWYRNGILLPADTAQKYRLSSTGYYKVSVSNAFGCVSFSDSIQAIPTSIAGHQQHNEIRVYPIPAKQQLHILFEQDDNNMSYALYDPLGKVLIKGTWATVLAGTAQVIPLTTLAPGNYYLKVNNDRVSLSRKISIVQE